MALEILKCTSCGKYLLSDVCSCNSKAQSPLPAKFSLDDAYAKYRRQVKEQDRADAGLL